MIIAVALLQINAPFVIFNAATFSALWLIGYHSIWTPAAMATASLAFMEVKIVAATILRYRLAPPSET